MSVDLPDYNESMANDPPAPEYPGEEGGGEYSVANEESALRADVEGGEAPPSYTSIYGQIKDAKATTTGNLDFAQVVCGILISSVIGIIFLALSGAFPIAQLVIGIKYKDMCPIQTLIPIWLIASGALGIAQVLQTLGEIFFTKRNSAGANSRGGCCRMLVSLIHLGAFGLFIAGSVWIYKVKDTVSFDPTNSTITPLMVNGTNGTESVSFYCDKTCYLFAFWTISSVYILLALMVLTCCVTCVMICCCVMAASDD